MAGFKNIPVDKIHEVTLDDIRTVPVMPRYNNAVPVDSYGTKSSESEQGRNLMYFALEVQKVFTACSFGIYEDREGRSLRVNTGATGYRDLSVHVYHKHKPLSMGEIGVRVYDGRAAEPTGHGSSYYKRADTFFVCSRKVSNAKYSEYSEGYNTVHTKNIDNAVRNARKYLVEASPVELATISGSRVRTHWESSGSSLKREVSQARDAVVRQQMGAIGGLDDILYAELQVIVNSGHTFINPDFGGSVDKFLSKAAERAELERERSSRVSMVSVEVSPQTGNPFFVVAHTEDISAWETHWEPKGTFAEDTLDPDITGKLAVLQMCDADQWVDGVGVKESTTVFYVVH